MSPGLATVMARWIHRLSFGGLCTVRAGPASRKDAAAGLIRLGNAPIFPDASCSVAVPSRAARRRCPSGSAGVGSTTMELSANGRRDSLMLHPCAIEADGIRAADALH